MTKLYCVICGKYRKFEKPKISYFLIVLSIICSKCKNEAEKKMLKVKIQKLWQQKARIMLLSKCAVCGSKKSKFIKEQEASRLLSSLGIKTPLRRIPFLELLTS